MPRLSNGIFPAPLGPLIQSLAEEGFFESSVLIGSWVMQVYGELYGTNYVLRTFDLDFAVAVQSGVGLRSDLDKLITTSGFTPFFNADGVKKFSGGGFEVEFFVHRAGGIPKDKKSLAEWGLMATPLPFIQMLLDFCETEFLGANSEVRFPIPESYFLHKLIVSSRRRQKEKAKRDLDQCAVLANIVRNEELRRVFESYRWSRITRLALKTSSQSIGFPLQERLSMTL